MPGGRPKKYTSPEDMQRDIDNYFKLREEDGKPMTVEGLAVALDMDRQSIVNYQRTEEFFGTIKKAKDRIAENFAQRALEGDYNPTLSIFLMKNNFNYKDKTETDLNANHKVESGMAELYKKTNG